MAATDKKRAKAYRYRRLLGLKVYQVELDRWHINQLLDSGLITEEAVNDRYVMAEQLGGALELLLSRHDVTG